MKLFGRSKESRDFDLFVLGGGSAAFAAAIRGAELGARVAVAEADVIGGTCVNRGCVPTKNLLHAAERFHQYRTNGFPGLPAGERPIRFPEVIAQKDELVEEMRRHKYVDLLEAYPNIRFLHGRARFRSPHEVELGGEVIGAESFVVATGASPASLPVEGIERTPYLTYKEALELPTLPGSMLIVGAGPIGLELGQTYARFGTKVTILEALPRIAPLEEPEISEALRGYLEAEGIEIHTGARVVRVAAAEGGVTVRAEIDGEVSDLHAERLLIAAGLQPKTSGLGLDAIGADTDRRGALVVDEELRTTARHVFGAGDVLGRILLVTVAAEQGGLAAENALGGKGKRFEWEAIPHAIFTSPEVASVGLKEEEARGEGYRVAVARIPFELVPKSAAIRDTRGLLKMVVDEKTYRILGVHLVSPDAANLVHVGVLAVRHELTVGDLLRATFVYPTLAEVFKIAAISFKKDVTKLSCCAQ
ncbi:MAG: mercury(II) reductase [Candidatus Binatia bacterium]